MNRVTITLHIDLPDGVIPVVDYGTPTMLDEVPLPEAPRYDADERLPATPFMNAALSNVPGCPQHGLMTRWPAGISKKTQKPYGASWRCNVQGCDTRPIWDKAA